MAGEQSFCSPVLEFPVSFLSLRERIEVRGDAMILTDDLSAAYGKGAGEKGRGC